MRAEANEVQAADITIVVLAIDLPHVAVPVSSHEHIQLLPYRVHIFLPQLQTLGFGFREEQEGEEGMTWSFQQH